MIEIPALIDAHVHLRTPGAEHKENWITGSRAAFNGGVTTLFDMPNTSPPTLSLEALHAKKALVEDQLRQAGLPIKAYFFLGADRLHFDEIWRCREEAVGLKIYMGSTTGDLLMEDDDAIEEAFRLGAEADLMVAVHAEEEAIIARNRERFLRPNSPPHLHSIIREPEAAVKAVDKAIGFAEKHGAKLYVLHLSTAGELQLIREAKKQGLRVYCEVTPHHLFLDTRAYETLGTLAQMNPPLRDPKDREALWEGIHEGIVDSIGTDHAPHTLDEKRQPYGLAPSGVPGLETMLPLLMDAHLRDKISLERLIQLTSARVRELYHLPDTGDRVVIDPELILEVDPDRLATKCAWTPFAGWKLKGWPTALLVQGKRYATPYAHCSV